LQASFTWRSAASLTLLAVATLAVVSSTHAQQAKGANIPSNKVKTTEVSTDHLRLRYLSEIEAAQTGVAALVLEIAPRPGMHVYAPGADDYQIIDVTIDKNPRVQPRPLRYPASEIYHFQPLDEKIPVYQKPFTLTVEAVVQLAAGPAAVSGRLEYQACDDRVCFAPVSVPLSWTVGRGGR
jgi:DsbC/DsbD-like thiol-disulfide interchange protein